MDTDKAYLLGLVIGGGFFGNAEDVFQIKLPFKKWGSYQENPQRGSAIANDIIRKVGNMFRAIYGLSVQYETRPGGDWIILCEGDTSALKADLDRYGIAAEGELRGTADIGPLIEDLVDDTLKRRFVAGLADTIGSMTKSHRRFSDEHQIISFEIKGYNFQFVCDLCRLLYSINCIPDQVNWNHPNIQCTNDPYYRQWNKGFKLRVLLDQYAAFGAFAFRTKAEASMENRQLQREHHEAEPCEDRHFHVTPSTVHPAEDDARLPDEIRGGHYIHFRHFCAVLGCEHAPYDEVASHFCELGKLVIPFAILSKDSLLEIERRIAADPLMADRSYAIHNVRVDSLIMAFENDQYALLYGTYSGSGYPIAEILKGVAYVIADDSELNGTRPKDGYLKLIKRHLAQSPNMTVELRRPDLLTPLVLVGNGRGAMVGAMNPAVYEKLVEFDPDNRYKMIVRKITEEDLADA